MKMIANIASMEPMLPPEGEKRLEDLAFEVIAKGSRLAGQLPVVVRRGVGDLVRSMNDGFAKSNLSPTP
jgi:hypothetical protein